MAEIRVQEKRSSLAWLWILLLLLLVAAGVWWWMTSQEQDSTMDATPVTTAPPVGASGPATMDTGFSTSPAPFDTASGALPPAVGDTVGFAPLEGEALAIRS